MASDTRSSPESPATTNAAMKTHALEQPSLSWRMSSSLVLGATSMLCRGFLYGLNTVETTGLDRFLEILDKRKDVDKRERGLITGGFLLYRPIFYGNTNFVTSQVQLLTDICIYQCVIMSACKCLEESPINMNWCLISSCGDVQNGRSTHVGDIACQLCLQSHQPAMGTGGSRHMF